MKLIANWQIKLRLAKLMLSFLVYTLFVYILDQFFSTFLDGDTDFENKIFATFLEHPNYMKMSNYMFYDYSAHKKLKI
jgi:hypothetical protein